MMSNINLLEIDIENLFVNHTIKEIQDVQKRIQAEIEKKRQELRCMVGYVSTNIIPQISSTNSLPGSDTGMF